MCNKQAVNSVNLSNVHFLIPIQVSWNPHIFWQEPITKTISEVVFVDENSTDPYTLCTH